MEPLQLRAVLVYVCDTYLLLQIFHDDFASLAACPFECSDNTQCCCSQPLDSDTPIGSQPQEKEFKRSGAFAFLVGCPFGCSDNSQCRCSQPLGSLPEEDTPIDSHPEEKGPEEKEKKSEEKEKEPEEKVSEQEEPEEKEREEKEPQCNDDMTLSMVEEDPHIYDDDPNTAEPMSVDLTSYFTTCHFWVFDTLVQAKDWIVPFGKSLGTIISIKKSDYSQNRSWYVDFRCERSGVARAPTKSTYVKKKDGEGRQAPRPSFSKLIDCPFLVKCKQNKYDKKWRFELKSGIHNHRLARFGVGHAMAAHLTTPQKEVVRAMAQTGTAPRYILKHIQSQDASCSAVSKTIYNQVARTKAAERKGRNIVQEVFRLADKEKTFIRHTSSNNTIDNIFWAPNISTRLANTFHTVFMMDCTYKCNRYKLPLLHIVGVTSTDISFSAGFALLSSEKEEQYTWALRMFRETLSKENMPSCIVTDRDLALMNGLKNVFPDAYLLLCRWHIQKDVKAYVTTSTMEDKKLRKPLLDKWSYLTYSEHEHDVERLLAEINELSIVVGAYMQKTWIEKFKEMFVEAWVKKVLHLGNTSTSRVEGVHGVLKKWLETSAGDLVTNWKAVESLVDTQVNHINASFEISLFKFPSAMLGLEWCKPLRESVSLFAIEKIREEIKRIDFVRSSVELCGCFVRNTLGLPCAHEIWVILQTRTTIPPSALHDHWRKLTIDEMPKRSFDNEGGIHPQVLFNMFMVRYEQETEENKAIMINRLKEAIDPSYTGLKEPPVMKKGRGRPRGAQGKKFKVPDDDETTKRDPSRWEYVCNVASQESVNKKEVGEEQKKKNNNKRKKPNEEEETKKNSKKAKAVSEKEVEDDKKDFKSNVYYHIYLDFIPKFYHKYVVEIEDVDKDGNCGFRAIARGLGLNENHWAYIRMLLYGELDGRKDLYSRLAIEDGWTDLLLPKLRWTTGSCTNYYWMESPDTLWMVTEYFQVGVSTFSPKLNLTIFPLTKPPLNDYPTHINIVFVNNNHFAVVQTKKNCPLPPIHFKWYEVRNEDASKWEKLYKKRLEAGRKLFKNDVDGGVVNLDES